jgi:IclR family acetate operon transcriptional repressor
MGKSRTFRLLQTLGERGYVDRCAEGARYRLGARLFERAANVRSDIRQLARPFMKSLHERFNETVNLGVLKDGDVLYLDILETSRPFRMTATVGCRMPAHKTALGKAMLAGLPEARSGHAVRPRLPAARPAQRQKLQVELVRVRRQGYAIDDEENEPGVACIGAAIMDAAGIPVAALSVSGPARRILGARKEIAQAVAASCFGISTSLGFQGSEEKL